MKLDKIDTRPPKKAKREELENKLAKIEQELGELQELMWGARQNGCLVVLQGRDTAGKDGTIKRVAGALNPRGVSVVSYGVPTEEERQHDFLWRVHRHAPRNGEFAIFNRSHYEDVLVVRVHNLVPETLWKERYDHIRDFEELLGEHGCIVLKYFLHISKKEQEERLLEREKDPAKAWKLNKSDWEEREYWDDYTKAYEAVFEKCPGWEIVPADSKWYRNYIVADSIVKALRPYREQWLETLARRGKIGRAELAKFKRKS